MNERTAPTVAVGLTKRCISRVDSDHPAHLHDARLHIRAMQTLSTQTRRTSIQAGAALVLVALVTLAGCSSDSSKPKSSDTKAISSTTASSTTATSAPSTDPECTVEAANAVLAPETATSIACGDGWAAGSKTNEEFDSAYLLRAESGAWAKADVAEACPAEGGAATNPLGIPQNVFDASPCAVS